MGYFKNSKFLQIFSRYEKCKQIALSVHRFLFVCARNYWVYLCVFIKIFSSSLNIMLIVDKHCCDIGCDEFPVLQTDRKSKQVKEQWHRKFYLQSVWWKARYLRHLHLLYQNLWINHKVRRDKNAVYLHFSTSAEYLQKWIFNFPR